MYTKRWVTVMLYVLGVALVGAIVLLIISEVRHNGDDEDDSPPSITTSTPAT